MQEITLTETVKDFYGKDVVNPDSTPLKVKDVLLAQLWGHETEDSVEAGKVFGVGTKIGSTTEEKIALEDAEVEIVKKTFEKKPRFVAAVTAQVIEKLQTK